MTFEEIMHILFDAALPDDVYKLNLMLKRDASKSDIYEENLYKFSKGKSNIRRNERSKNEKNMHGFW